MAEQMQPMPDVPERCPFCNSGDRREETWRGSPAYSFSCGTVFLADGEVAFRYGACNLREKEWLLEQLAAARAEAERLKTENERLHRRIERLAAKIARQRAVISRLQAAIERRNSEERIEAMRRALHDETVERYMREYDAAADEAERWRQQYEALRAGVEHVLQLIAREERNEGFLEPDLEEIRRMLTAALGEAGGVSQ